MKVHGVFHSLLLVLTLGLRSFAQDDHGSLEVGLQKDGRIVVPTNQVLSPAGRQTYIPTRANDIAVSPDGTRACVLGHGGFVILDAANGTILGVTTFTKIGGDNGGSYKGIAFTPDGKQVVASNIAGALDIFTLARAGERTSKTSMLLKDGDKALVPAGLRLNDKGDRAWVTLITTNDLAEIDLAQKKILRRISVGNAPFDVVVHEGLAYVSNFGGGIPKPGDSTGPGGENMPEVKVDPVRHIASEGAISVVDLAKGAEVAQILVGLHPSGLALSTDGKRLYVANANSDTVSVVDTEKQSVVETISTRPAKDLIFGSAPNDLELSADGARLFVSNGANNAICVIALSEAARGAGAESEPSKVIGFLPTGWYPAGLALDPNKKSLWVANIKGIGSRRKDLVEERPGSGIKGGSKIVPSVEIGKTQGYNTHESSGSVSLIRIPSDAEIARQTKKVIENNRMTESISALMPGREGIAPKPVPERHGEPSVFEHVVYIIKENRTYDQVFGDMPEGNGEPSLCMYGEEVTPNCHKIAREFVLLDNFYCSGVNSADGHQWVAESYVTSYIEKAYGGFPRSYPYDGGDALAYSAGGFLWDNCLAHGKTFRTYGEFVFADIRWKDKDRQAKGGPRFLDCYKDFLEKKNEIDIIGRASIASLVPYTCTRTIGFPSIVPDLYRADVFIQELKRFEEQGGFPNLSMILIPNDHTAGTRPRMPTPRASVADNDLALGRIIEAISKSKFWPKTCILVVQDDPQNGFDHVDGHRTLALAVSPYTKRKSVISTNYNQTGMVRTIELILGLPPMNQFDSSAIPMTDCFMETPDLTPYDSVPNRIPLDELNPELSEISDPHQLYWAKKSLELPLDDIDEAPEDTLNRILWHAAKGQDAPYPEQYVHSGWEFEREDEDD
ncbi:MAG: hypothetical protein GHCLOJNM_03862 [bacterium]|nr:hypothetical protein [bacterium]